MKRKIIAVLTMTVMLVSCLCIGANAADYRLDFGQVSGETRYFSEGQRVRITISQNTPINYTKNSAVDIAARGIWNLFDCNKDTKVGISINDERNKCHFYDEEKMNCDKTKTYDLTVTDSGYYTFALRNITSRKRDNSYWATIPEYTMTIGVY